VRSRIAAIYDRLGRVLLREIPRVEDALNTRRILGPLRIGLLMVLRRGLDGFLASPLVAVVVLVVDLLTTQAAS
jgi:hypothetical protein